LTEFRGGARSDESYFHIKNGKTDFPGDLMRTKERLPPGALHSVEKGAHSSIGPTTRRAGGSKGSTILCCVLRFEVIPWLALFEWSRTGRNTRIVSAKEEAARRELRGLFNTFRWPLMYRGIPGETFVADTRRVWPLLKRVAGDSPAPREHSQRIFLRGSGRIPDGEKESER